MYLYNAQQQHMQEKMGRIQNKNTTQEAPALWYSIAKWNMIYLQECCLNEKLAFSRKNISFN